MAGILRTYILVVVAIFWSHVTVGHPVRNGDKEVFSLRIVHTNDMHARFDETSALSTKCSAKDAEAKKCYGGFARIATLVRQARNSSSPTLFLNAGDTYQGTVWFNVHKWEIVSTFLNLLAPDAISLGNHEFDNGVEGLVPFIHAAEFPIVTANLDLSGEPKLAATKLKNSTVLDVNGTKIGIIGYLTPETKIISSTGKVNFLDEVESIKREVDSLQAQGIKILIAVGHSGFEMDKKIAAEVEGLDLVIGGHTNTFLYTGKRPDIEAPEGLYPTEILQKNGRKVYVVQAYAYTKYLGNINVDFDDQGEVKNIVGNPILVDGSVEQAKDILKELEKFRPGIDAVDREELGSTKVLLDGDSKSCRRHECNLGNLICDAMIDYNARQYGADEGWTDAAIAVHNSGTIRSSINKAPSEKITMGDVLAVLPFNNGLVKVKLNGRTILEVLEWSVQSLKLNETANLNGAYLQFSGLQIIYDMSKPAGSRVHSVKVRCADCRVPDYSKLKDDEMYTVLTTDFMRAGGDGYSMMMDANYTTSGVTTDFVLAEYLKTKGPVHPGVEWRIDYLTTTTPEDCSGDDKQKGGSASYGPIGLMISLPLIALRSV